MFDPPVIAVIEDDEAVREALSDLLQVVGLQCRTYARAESFLATDHAAGTFGCLITDVRLPGISGLDLLERLRGLGSTMPVIVITSHTDPNICLHAMEGGAHACLTKPLCDDVLLKHLKLALGHDILLDAFDDKGKASDD